MHKPNYKGYLIQFSLIVALGMVLALDNAYIKQDMLKHELNQCTVESEVLQATVNLSAKEKQLNEKELTCLAMNIYFESGNKSYEEKLAIATVTLNRVNSDKYPKTICGVVWEKRPRAKKCQFAWTCDGKPDHIKYPNKYLESLEIAKEVLANEKKSAIIDSGTMHFHENSVRPYWSDKMLYIATIGSHRFYREGG
jgi:spore germination cell wall hydrolase CwlJ-like protein